MSVPAALHTYLAFWNASDRAERDALLARCVTPEVIFADPQSYHEGLDALARNATAFHGKYPGAVLTRTSGIDTQNRRYRYTWRIEVAGRVLLDGMDVATLAPDGRIERVDGFFGPIRPHEDAAG